MRRRKESASAIAAVITAIILILGLVWSIDTVRRLFQSEDEAILIDDRFSGTEPPVETETQTFTEPSETREMEINEASLLILPSGYTTERKSEESVHNGLLAMTAGEYSGSRMTDFTDRNEYYHLKTIDLQIQENTVRAMNALAEAYFEETGKSDLMIYSTTELYRADGSLYSDILPDRSTGFCLDLAFLNEDGTFSPINQENNFWLKENAWRFGFIFSIPEAGYHIRYIGKLHASAIYEQNLTLEAYLDMLRGYRYTEPYRYQIEERAMLIYFVPAAAFGSTDIPVPENRDYEISGNDTDGFIVWTAATADDFA